MTIAACYLCPEGVVLGSDSTATFPPASGQASGSHFNHTQKLFEIGDGGSLGLVTWGAGGVGATSYRTLLARLGDQFAGTHPSSVLDATWRWSTLVWSEYAAFFAPMRQRAQDLVAKGNRSPDEDKELNDLIAQTVVGFCIGGCCGPMRTPEAFEVWLFPQETAPPTPRAIPMGVPKFWGWSNLIERLSFGMDYPLFTKILNSGKWNGTPDELRNLVVQNKLAPAGILPIREAIDWVYSSIYTTIKGFKFSLLEPVCGGPIEIAAITTDRKFRWVHHKSLASAIS